MGFLHKLGLPHGEGNGTLLQHSCLENPMGGESLGGQSLVGYNPWGCKESDTTERLHCTSRRITHTVNSVL